MKNLLQKFSAEYFFPAQRGEGFITKTQRHVVEKYSEILRKDYTDFTGLVNYMEPLLSSPYRHVVQAGGSLLKEVMKDFHSSITMKELGEFIDGYIVEEDHLIDVFSSMKKWLIKQGVVSGHVVTKHFLHLAVEPLLVDVIKQNDYLFDQALDLFTKLSKKIKISTWNIEEVIEVVLAKEGVSPSQFEFLLHAATKTEINVDKLSTEGKVVYKNNEKSYNHVLKSYHDLSLKFPLVCSSTEELFSTNEQCFHEMPENTNSLMGGSGFITEF